MLRVNLIIFLSLVSMKQSSFILGLLLFTSINAAPQHASLCPQIPQNPAAGQIPAQYLNIPGCGDSPGSGSTSEVGDKPSSDSTNTSNSSSSFASVSLAKPQQPSTNATTLGSGGKCPAGFRNAVFNTGAPRNAGWPQKTWDSLTANGVNDWSESDFAINEFST